MLDRHQLTTTDSRIYTVPSGRRAIVHAIYIANTTAARRTFRLHHCRDGEASAVANAMFYDVAIAANGTLIDSTRFRMSEGDQLRGLGDAAGLSVTVHGTEE
jgi:hypothetical protein